MDKHWIKACLLGVATCAIASADAGDAQKQAAMGAFEAGIGWGTQTTAGTKTSGTQFLIDQAVMHKKWEASEKTHVVLENVISTTGQTVTPTVAQNGGNFTSKYRLTDGNGDATKPTFIFANSAAYIEHKADGVGIAVGNMRTPFSFENTVSRFDMQTYYYSAGYSKAQTYGWNYDVGAKLSLTDTIPGNLEVGLFEGRTQANEDYSPSIAARYSMMHDAGDYVITPSVATYLGRWRGGPKDLGIAVGANGKFGTFLLNAEWIYTARNSNAASDTKTKLWNLYLEPGMDLGVADVSAKWELVNNSTNSDMNLGVSLGKNYSDKLRVRATYQFANISEKLGSKSHDVRLLVGAKF